MSIAGILRRWVLVSAVTGVLGLIQVPGVRAQAVQPVQMPPNPNPNQPVPTAPSAGPLNPADVGVTAPGATVAPEPLIGAPAAEAPGVAPGGLIGAPAAEPSTGKPPRQPLHSPTGLSVLDVIGQSLFDSIYAPEDQSRWSPLTLGTFFSEGWDVPYVNPTAGNGGLAGTGGVPRQGWLGNFGAYFFRAWFFAFFYDQGINSKIGNGYIGQYTAFVPMNRRFEFEIDYFFAVSNKGGTSNTYHTNTGDTTIWGRFQLQESKNFGQLFQVGFNIPTGNEENGQGAAVAKMWYEASWNFWDKWLLKFETGPNVVLNHAKTSGYSQYHNNLAIGRYFPGSKESWFQQWWFYLVAEADSTIAGPHPKRNTFAFLLPGMRCKMTDPILTNIGTGLWYFFAGVLVPLDTPAKSFSYEPIFALLYDF